MTNMDVSISATKPALTDDEQREYTKRTRIAQRLFTRGVKNLNRAMRILEPIEEKELWRGEYPSYRHFLQGTLKYSRQHIYRLVDQHTMNLLLSPTGDMPQLNEAQTRELKSAKLTPEATQVVAVAAQQTALALGVPLSAPIIKSTIETFRTLAATGTVDGESKINQISAETILRMEEDIKRAQNTIKNYRYEHYASVETTVRDALLEFPSLIRGLSVGVKVRLAVYIEKESEQ